MNILEFIRKNSLLVLIVIVGVGAGLVMMDYSGKASAFSRNYYIEVDNTGYDYPEVSALGENGKEYLASLLQATRRLLDQFDTNGDERFDEQEAAALTAWQQAHPEVGESFARLNSIYADWSFGVAQDNADNIAITRLMLRAEAKALGLAPSEEQIDAYLRDLPAFRTLKGEFNTALYQRLTGYRNGISNRVQEENFRSVVADIIIWEALQAIVSKEVHFNSQAELERINASAQSISGRTALIPTDKVPAPAEPTEEELQTYWEANKALYKSPERRIISVYTLTPDQESNMENLSYTADTIMENLSAAQGQGLDKLLADTADNAEHQPFTYKGEDGSTHVTYPLSTQEELLNLLKENVNFEGAETPLARVAFSETAGAPTPQSYEQALESGSVDKLSNIKQIRGFYTTMDDKQLKLIRIEAVEAPEVLPFEAARERALVDFRAQREAEAVDTFAQKLGEEMKNALAEKGLDAAFALATQAGATIAPYGPTRIADPTQELPDGVRVSDLMSTPSGKLAPTARPEGGIRFTSVERRTVEDSPAISAGKLMFTLPRENAQLRYDMMKEWISSAYKRFNVNLSQHVRTRGSDN